MAAARGGHARVAAIEDDVQVVRVREDETRSSGSPESGGLTQEGTGSLVAAERSLTRNESTQLHRGRNSTARRAHKLRG